MHPTHELAGLRVLITRPERQAAKWQALLSRLGAAIFRAPLLEIEAFSGKGSSSPETRQLQFQIDRLAQYQHLIFVSQNAAHYGNQWIKHRWSQLPNSVHCYAVGSATAQCLTDNGIEVSAANGSMNSEALLALPELCQLTGQKVLIFRGQGGRPLIASELEKRGARVEYAELYRRVFPQATLDILQKSNWGQQGDVVALHSGESLTHWHQSIERLDRPHWRQLPILVPGTRVQLQAQNLGFSTIITANTATDADMSHQLILWHQNQDLL